MIINSKLCPQLRWNNTNFLLLSWLALFIIQLDFVVMCSFSRCYIDTHSHMEPFRGGKAWGSGKGQKAWDPFSLIFFILYFHLDPKNRMINWQHNIITREKDRDTQKRHVSMRKEMVRSFHHQLHCFQRELNQTKASLHWSCFWN